MQCVARASTRIELFRKAYQRLSICLDAIHGLLWAVFGLCFGLCVRMMSFCASIIDEDNRASTPAHDAKPTKRKPAFVVPRLASSLYKEPSESHEPVALKMEVCTFAIILLQHVAPYLAELEAQFKSCYGGKIPVCPFPSFISLPPPLARPAPICSPPSRSPYGSLPPLPRSLADMLLPLTLVSSLPGCPSV